MIDRMLFYLSKWLATKAADINHNAITKDIMSEVEISAGYFLILTIANMIALIGLITNNTAVIIGAMLISPFMGPILSSGFAFITGDIVIGRKALKKIGVSLALTILIAAMATYISPLQEITEEIIARTRPNLYDLMIAFLAGMAGAISICTKKSYITIVTGVAIATAVIPPLSVTGFGIGTGNFQVAFGGFFLFFTNLVAIIISTCIVFFTYGFKPVESEEQHSHLKKSFSIFAILLFVISIPLIYTLQMSIKEIKMRHSIQSALKLQFDRLKHSHMVSFSFMRGEDNKIEINAIVNTIDYIKETEVIGIEKSLAEYLRNNITLNVEQILVKAGGLKEELPPVQIPVMISSAPAPMPSKEETIKSSLDASLGNFKKISEQIEKIITPSKVIGFYVGFRENSVVSVILKIKRDTQLSHEQNRWLQQILSDLLHTDVELTVETVPWVPSFIFKAGEKELTDEMKSMLLKIKEIYTKSPQISITIGSYPSHDEGKKRIKNAEERAIAIERMLLEENIIPKERLRTLVYKETQEKMLLPAVNIIISE